MAQDWFYKLLGEEAGPLRFHALRGLVADGHLGADDEVRTSSTVNWRRAGDVPELFAEGDVEEPELATDYDLDLLLTSDSGQFKLSPARLALEAARKAAAAPPRIEWYYKLLGQEMGPATTEQVEEQITAGSLHADDLIRKGSDRFWAPLEEVADFRNKLAAMRPKAEWYCRVLGQELGPMTFDELEEMVSQGSLHSDDEVRFENGNWNRADRVRGLSFNAQSSSVAVASSHDRTATYVPFGDDAKRKEWYTEIVGHVTGPSSFQDLKKAVAKGTLKLEDKARKGKTGPWISVIDIPGLVTSEQRADHVAAKVEAAKPKSIPVFQLPPTATPQATAAPPAARPTPAASAPPEPSMVASPAPMAEAPRVSPPTPRPMPVAPSTSSYGGMGSRPMATPARPSFQPPPRRSSGSSFNLGEMLGPLKEMANPKAIAAVVAIALVGVYFGLPALGLNLGGTPGKAEYMELRPMMLEAIKLQDGKSAEADWTAFFAKHQKRLDAIAESTKKQGPSSDKPILSIAFQMSKNVLPAMSQPDQRKGRIKTVAAEMKIADQKLGLK